MSWVKQSDTLWRDPEFTKLTDGAQALWHRANSYIADQLTDGHIPAEALKHLNTRKRYVDELVIAGFWICQPIGGWLAAGWQIFIRSKADVLAKRTEQSQRDKRKSPRQPGASLLPPGPVPVLFSSVNSELNSESRLTSSTSDACATEPAVPPAVQKSGPKVSWLRVWWHYERSLKSEGMLGHPERHRGALDSIAAAVTGESGVSHGEAFDRAAQRLLGAWLADPWVAEHTPPLRNLADNLAKYRPDAPVAKPAYAGPPPKPALELAYERMRACQAAVSKADQFSDKAALLEAWKLATTEWQSLKEKIAS